MKKISTTKLAALGGLVTVGALTATALCVPAQAQALTGYVHRAHTELAWGGPSCAAIIAPNAANRLAADRECSYTNTWEWNETIATGEYYGGNVPLTGGLSWVSCSTWLDGQLVATDYATAALGSGEANCLRTA